MLKTIVNKLTSSILNRLPVVDYLCPLKAVPASQAGFDLREIFDGYLLACPKRRNNYRTVMRKRYGNDNWKDGVKLWKPKRNIVTCMECGSFHEFHTICKNCFKKVEEESKKIMEDIRSAWTGQPIDKEVQVLYQGETVSSDAESKKIIEMDRPRPLWFSPNLSQTTADPSKQIGGPVMNSEKLEARIKDSE